MFNDLEIPLIKKPADARAIGDCAAPSEPNGSCGTCGTKSCAAVRHIEDVAAELDELRREVRQTERHHAEDMKKLGYKIGALVAVVVTLVPSGWACFLGLI